MNSFLPLVLAFALPNLINFHPGETTKEKPLMRDFIGLNTHTVQFKPDLYKPVTRLVRDYHPVEWDLGTDPSAVTQFPMSRNGVDWQSLYGKWKTECFGIDASAMFSSIDVAKWTDLPKQAFAYGESFARFFGPSGDRKLVQSFEVDNEPAKLSGPLYRQLFEGAARGVRKGDPKMLISTCAVAIGDKDQWSKDVNLLRGLEPLYDVLNVHTYAFAKFWPTWERSNPEDSATSFLKAPQSMIDWRNQNAPGKQVWVTEFGWDASTKTPPKAGEGSEWIGSTDLEQARYIVRSYLLFSEMDIDRAYLYWFNDDDKPSLHAASGLTRNYQPKPSFYAVGHLLKTLGDYRFSRIVEKTDRVYAYEFERGDANEDRVLVVWSPTRRSDKVHVDISIGNRTVLRAQKMPLSPTPVTAQFKTVSPGKVSLDIDGTPVYLWVNGQ